MEDISEFLDVNISCDTTDDAGKDTNSVGEKKHTAESSADNQQKSGDGDMNDSDGDRDGEKNKLCRIKSLCLRTDLSALAKVDQILQIIDSDGKDQTNNKKREAEEQLDRGDSSAPKQFKPDTDPEGEKAEDEDDDADCCVVCALPLRVFKEDNAKEVHHYLSHGFRVLKEFDVLKKDDSLFLMCNICDSVYPKKCFVNFRKHLVEAHTDRVVEIFRCE